MERNHQIFQKVPQQSQTEIQLLFRTYPRSVNLFPVLTHKYGSSECRLKYFLTSYNKQRWVLSNNSSHKNGHIHLLKLNWIEKGHILISFEKWPFLNKYCVKLLFYFRTGAKKSRQAKWLQKITKKGKRCTRFWTLRRDYLEKSEIRNSFNYERIRSGWVFKYKWFFKFR